MRNRTVSAAALAFALVVVSGAALAQAAPDLNNPTQSFEGLLDLINQQAGAWGPRLRGYAFSLFWALAGIQLTWSLGQLAFKNAELGEVLGELVRQVMTIGFWLAFLMFSVDWCSAIVNSFRKAGASAAGVGDALNPGDMFRMGVNLATNMSNVGLIGPFEGFALAVSCAIVLLCFVFIAALMAVALVESYIVINAGVLFMGFAGSSWTRDTAMAFVKYAISVGAKLFILTLLVGIVLSSSKEWAIAYNHSDASMWTLVGLALVCAYLCKSIPDLIQALISGSSVGGGGAIGGIAAAGAAFGMAAMAAVKTVATGGAAAPLAAGAAANAAGSGMAAAGANAGGSAAGRGFQAMFGGGGSGAGQAASASEGTAGLGGRFGEPGAKASSAGSPPSAPNAAPSATPAASSGSGGASDQRADTSQADAAGENESSEPAGNADTGQSTFGRIGDALAHGGKASWALGAMTTPGMDATPDASALMGGGHTDPATEDGAGEGESDSDGDQLQANVIRPAGPVQSVPRATPPALPPKK